MNEIILDSLPPGQTSFIEQKPNQTNLDSESSRIKNIEIHGLIRMIDSNSIFYNSEVNIFMNYIYELQFK